LPWECWETGRHTSREDNKGKLVLGSTADTKHFLALLWATHYSEPAGNQWWIAAIASQPFGAELLLAPQSSCAVHIPKHLYLATGTVASFYQPLSNTKSPNPHDFMSSLDVETMTHHTATPLSKGGHVNLLSVIGINGDRCCDNQQQQLTLKASRSCMEANSRRMLQEPLKGSLSWVCSPRWAFPETFICTRNTRHLRQEPRLSCVKEEDP